MNVHQALSGTMLAMALLGLAASARAQDAPPAPPPTAEPDTARRGPKDGARLRGGLSANGGMFFLPANPAGGAASISGRIGLQFNHALGLYYQNTPIVGATMAPAQRSGAVVAADYNSLLLSLTLLHIVDLGLGPSLDYVAVAKGSIAPSPSLATGTGVAAGGHGRVAIHIGGLSGEGPRRSGLAIGADAHPMFLATGKALSLTAGLGVEWY
jgi:hypothetical protein